MILPELERADFRELKLNKHLQMAGKTFQKQTAGGRHIPEIAGHHIERADLRFRQIVVIDRAK